MSVDASKRGFVSLVGAGPGDPDLVTLRGLEALRRADAVLYDDLAPVQLLEHAPPDAERIPVGKRAHDAPTRSQEEINALLVELARQGKRVVRLKGGDPFVFGRGGEEASACRAAGVDFEVVPGVSSSIAALAYAGIPITDRRHSASFAVVTGHKDPTRVSEATRWAELATAVDTLVILMGMRNLSDLVDKLIAGGKAPDTPAAVVMNASLPEQRVVEAALSELPDAVERAGLGAPAAVVIGNVVRLRGELAWSGCGPLRGSRVLVTRAVDQAQEMLEAIRAAGGRPVLVPMIELVAPESWAPLDAALDDLASFDALAFTSANAVRFFARRAAERGISLAERVVGRVACVGNATARAAREAGLDVTLVAGGRGDADALLAEIRAAWSSLPKRWLLPRSEIGREVLGAGLRRAGVEVAEVVAYRHRRPAVDAAGLCRELAAGELRALTFASPSAVEHLVSLLDAPGRAGMTRCILAAMGKATADALRSEGFEPDVVPERPGGRELVAALVDYVERTGAAAADSEPEGGGA